MTLAGSLLDTPALIKHRKSCIGLTRRSFSILQEQEQEQEQGQEEEKQQENPNSPYHLHCPDRAKCSLNLKTWIAFIHLADFIQ